MDFIALDFETANFKRQSVCSIGLAIVENGEIIKTVNRLIKPTPNYFENINMSIHGITPEMTKNESDFFEIWEDLKPFFDNKRMVAHNASFDFSALRNVLDVYNITYPDIDYYCSMLISKKSYPGLINYQLPTICKYLEINDLSHHDAVSDAVACANIMIKILKANNASTLQELETKYNFSKGQIYPNSYTPFSCSVRKTTVTKKLFDIIPQTNDFDEEHPFFNKRVVFTGALSTLSRNDAKQIVANIGGIIKPDTLSNKTNYLVVGTYDYNKYGEGYKSGKMRKAEEMIESGKDLEIISETDFFRMVHSESNSFEISYDQIMEDSKYFLKQNIYNELSGKTVFFSKDMSVERTIAFQFVGDCGGLGHDYDNEEIPNSDYYVISSKHITDLEKGIKSKSIIDFEKIRNEAQNRGNVKSIKLISESAFYEYIQNREKFQKGIIEMTVI